MLVQQSANAVKIFPCYVPEYFRYIICKSCTTVVGLTVGKVGGTVVGVNVKPAEDGVTEEQLKLSIFTNTTPLHQLYKLFRSTTYQLLVEESANAVKYFQVIFQRYICICKFIN